MIETFMMFKLQLMKVANCYRVNKKSCKLIPIADFPLYG